MMNHADQSNYDGVLEIVRGWPLGRQMALVRDVLERVATRLEPAKRRQPTLDRALGLLATDRPAPSDAEVEQWLDERRTEKYR